ncbi:histidinol-phosphate transaminase [Terrarubrum flagellatum]|uniref:pyridoxal phosphate-dependent aminotransferase n=1 Tax=Terrirubrum flagellatum TaxID=2895980 RepID=UPI0031452D0E
MNDASPSLRSPLHERVIGVPLGAPPSPPEPDLKLDPKLRRLHLNESPLPPSPRVIEAVTAAARDGAYYPDFACTALADRLSRMTGVSKDVMTFGNGSGDLLIAATLATVGPGDEAVMATPTFVTCGRGVVLTGAKKIEVPVRDDGVTDMDAMIAAITPRTRLVYMCSPNNPTGGPSSREELQALAKAVPEDVVLLIDEAYFEFGRFAGGVDALDIVRERKGAWIITRTLSKAYSLAGFRVGYSYSSDKSIAEALAKSRPSFIVGRIALAAACAAVDDRDYHEKIVRTVSQERDRLAGGFRQLGFNVLPSATNFIMAIPAAKPAAAFASALAAKGLLAQAMPWRGPNGALRMSIGTAADSDAVLETVREELAKA